jgi:hypothetical protein
MKQYISLILLQQSFNDSQFWTADISNDSKHAQFMQVTSKADKGKLQWKERWRHFGGKN